MSEEKALLNQVNEQIAFANARVTAATAQVHAQCGALQRLESSRLDTSALSSLCEEAERELRQWEEYRTLLYIKKGMIKDGMY